MKDFLHINLHSVLNNVTTIVIYVSACRVQDAQTAGEHYFWVCLWWRLEGISSWVSCLSKEDRPPQWRVGIIPWVEGLTRTGRWKNTCSLCLSWAIMFSCPERQCSWFLGLEALTRTFTARCFSGLWTQTELVDSWTVQVWTYTWVVFSFIFLLVLLFPLFLKCYFIVNSITDISYFLPFCPAPRQAFPTLLSVFVDCAHMHVCSLFTLFLSPPPQPTTTPTPQGLLFQIVFKKYWKCIFSSLRFSW